LANRSGGKGGTVVGDKEGVQAQIEGIIEQ